MSGVFESVRDEADHWHNLRERLHTEIRAIVGGTPREQRSGDADADLIDAVRKAVYKEPEISR